MNRADPSIDLSVAKWASRQHGLVTRSQAKGAGASDEVIERRVTTGRWVRIGPGVYRLAGTPVTWRQRALASCLVAGTGAVLSHRSAAALYGVSGFRPGLLDVTAPSGRGNRHPLATVHRTLHLPRGDRARLNGIPVTSPARTLLDLAGCLSGERLEEAVDDLLCRRLLTFERLMRRFDEPGPRRGRPALQAVLSAWSPDAVADSVAEMRLVRALVAAGLPEPVRQYEIVVGGVIIARADIAFPDGRVDIEMDSFRWHAGRGPFRSDRARRNRIEAAGWHVLQATPDDSHDWRQLCAHTAALLRRVA